MPHLPRSASVLNHFSGLSDPRQRWRVLYPLPEILLLVLCATLSGMEDFVEIRLWGQQRLDFLRRFLPYERGLPAHDTLNDVINGLDAELFKTCFANWVEALRERAPDIIAIDGKTSRRTHARRKGREPLHLVSAWAARQRLVLGQQAIDEKSNEIVAIPLLLERLELTGALVTIDAMGTQTEIAEKIVGRGARERRYYLSSAKLDAKTFAAAVRAHWGIENRLHWVLDVVFHDDLARLRSRNGPQNMAIVKHMAMNLVRNPKDKHSLKVRRKLANLNPDNP